MILNFDECVAYQLNWTMIDLILLSWIQVLLRVPRFSLAMYLALGTAVSVRSCLSCTLLGFTTVDQITFFLSKGDLAIF